MPLWHWKDDIQELDCALLTAAFTKLASKQGERPAEEETKRIS